MIGRSLHLVSQSLPADEAGTASDAALSQVSQAFFGQWMTMRGDAPMPGACDVHPAKFRTLLPQVRCMRWDGPDRLIFTLWGTGLSDWLKVDPTGQDVFKLIPPEERELEMRRLRNLHNHPCGFVQRRSVTDMRGTAFLFEFLTLPVAAGADGMSRFIGTGSICSDPPIISTHIDPDRRTVQKTFRYLDTGFGIPADGTG